ncbi:MAG: hypothetical protein AAFV37_07330 [Pseudomonadota bacterium]
MKDTEVYRYIYIYDLLHRDLLDAYDYKSDRIGDDADIIRPAAPTTIKLDPERSYRSGLTARQQAWINIGLALIGLSFLTIPNLAG